MQLKKNAVIFKGGRNGINIVLDNDTEFGELKRILVEKLSDAGDFFSDAKAAVSFSGRTLSEEEEGELLDIILNGSGINISYVGKAARPAPQVIPEFSHTENMTYYHTGSLRNGQSIRYGGSVVVIGDVNPGGEIIAEGNIIVLGTVKGVVHAGCTGSRDCYVAALNLQPTQLRIASVITYIPQPKKTFIKRDTRKESNPVYAYINEGRIYVEPLTN